MNINAAGVELFLADRRTDRHDEANSRFSQFCEKRLKSIDGPLSFRRKYEIRSSLFLCLVGYHLSENRGR